MLERSSKDLFNAEAGVLDFDVSRPNRGKLPPHQKKAAEEPQDMSEDRGKLRIMTM